MAMPVHSAGLGKLNVTSSLGEPFKAEIELTSTTPEELETLTAVIASQEAYAAQGISRLGIHNDIKVQVAAGQGGQSKILLRSSKPVDDPYLDMLIQLDWASGRLQREYTVLLDPPTYKNEVAQTIAKTQPVEMLPPPATKPLVTIPTIEDAPIVQTQTQNALTPELPDQPLLNNQIGNASGIKTEAEIEAEIARIEAQAKGGDQFEPKIKTNPIVSAPAIPTESTVKKVTRATQKRTASGDTLTAIAKRMRVPGVSLNQMLVGLYEYNKSAFVNGNMNRLKVGKVIKVPSKQDLLSVSRTQASETVVLHTNDWKSYRYGVANAISDSTNVDVASQADSGSIQAVEPKNEAPANEDKDVVKLSAGEQDKIAKDAKLAEEARKAAEEEDKIASEKALAEAQDRTEAVEKQIEDMQKLLAMKNQAMQELEKGAKETNEAVEDAEPISESNPKADEAVDDAVVDKASEDHESTPMPTKEVKPEPVKNVEAPVEEGPGLFANMANLPMIGGLIGILALIGGWLFLRNKRRKDLESFERGILTSGGLRANTVFGNTTGNTSTADTSFLTDFAQTTDGSMMDTNEVDPIAEAEVYMAYGREAQAEEILKDAIKKEPKRYELHTKLLEIYAERKDKSAFETVAGELYTSLGAEDPVWAKVVEMGKGLEPENPLYGAQPPASKNKSEAISNEAESDLPVLDKIVEKPQEDAESVAEVVENKVEAVADSAKQQVENVGVKTAAIGAGAAAVVAKGVSRIESIVRHTSPAKVSDDEVAESSLDENSIDFEIDSNDLNVSTEGSEADNFSLDGAEDITIESNFENSDTTELEPDLSFELSVDDQIETNSGKDDTDIEGFDLSGISLDLDGDTRNDEDSTVALNSESVANEPELGGDEVEVKLNLVAAYIDMDDKEGARELLEEVMKEGSDEQVLRAQMMIDSIS